MFGYKKIVIVGLLFLNSFSVGAAIVYRVPVGDKGKFKRCTITTPQLKTLPNKVIKSFNGVMVALEKNNEAMRGVLDFYNELWKTGNLALYKARLSEVECNLAHEYKTIKAGLNSAVLDKLLSFESLILKSQSRLERIKRWVGNHPFLTTGSILLGGYAVSKAHSALSRHTALNKIVQHGLGKRVRNTPDPLVKAARKERAEEVSKRMQAAVLEGALDVNPRGSINEERIVEGKRFRVKSAREPGHPEHGYYDSIDSTRNVDRAFAAWRIDTVGPEAWWLSTPEGKKYLQDFSEALKAAQPSSVERRGEIRSYWRQQYKEKIDDVRKNKWKIVVPKTHLMRSSQVSDRSSEIDDDHYVVLEEELPLRYKSNEAVWFPWTDEWTLSHDVKHQMALAAYLSGSTDVHGANVRTDLLGADGKLMEKVAFIDTERFAHNVEVDKSGALKIFPWVPKIKKRAYEKKKSVQDMAFALWLIRSHGQDEYFAREARVSGVSKFMNKYIKLFQSLVAGKQRPTEFRIEALLARISDPLDKKTVQDWLDDRSTPAPSIGVLKAVNRALQS